LKVSFTPLALADLKSIHRFIALDNPDAATRTVIRIRRAVQNLETFPELGRPWEGGPTRALSIAGIPYRVHYRVRGDALQILRIYHTARMPPLLQSEGENSITVPGRNRVAGRSGSERALNANDEGVLLSRGGRSRPALKSPSPYPDV